MGNGFQVTLEVFLFVIFGCKQQKSSLTWAPYRIHWKDTGITQHLEEEIIKKTSLLLLLLLHSISFDMFCFHLS